METFFFVGFEGSGKKTIASLLASRKNIQYIDIEKLIEHDEKTSIYNIENIDSTPAKTIIISYFIAIGFTSQLN
ncbi:MAG: hypothetical protein MJ151_03210 [Lachnospiraceae bacterium]|nr:hypothetical protein [Lachnospiraceae bacterium]